MSQFADSDGLSNNSLTTGGILLDSSSKYHSVRLRIAMFGKRSLDVAVSSLAMLFLLPLLTVVMATLLIVQGRPIFISRGRVGRGGTNFPCFKFRTMVTNAEETLREYLSHNENALKEWRDTQKLKNDPRITPLGHFLRKSSLDELPQLMNVLRGEMSLVGPRPIVRDEMARYGDYIEDYLQVRPGITGLWQVSGRSDLSYENRVELDVRYVREWNLWLDTVIIAKTVPAVLRSEGAR